MSVAGVDIVDVVDVIAVFLVVDEQHDAPAVLLFFVTVVASVVVAHSSVLEAFLASGVTVADEVVAAVEVVEQHEAEAEPLPFFESPQAACVVTAITARDIAATTKRRIVVFIATPCVNGTMAYQISRHRCM